uniref:MULE transposase domain-containing protein n=1 Tax=Acrobeloides nanus TaxID=290746 RepID=A0A914DKJ9_9BILA
MDDDDEFYEFFVVNDNNMLEEGEIVSENEEENHYNDMMEQENVVEQLDQQDEEITGYFFESSRGGTKLFLMGRLYNRKKVNNAGLEYYYCVGRDEHGCRGCVHLNPATNHFTVKNGHVEHPMVSNQDVEVMIFKRKLYRASSTNVNLKSRSAIVEELKTISPEGKTKISEKNMRSISQLMSMKKRELRANRMGDPLSLEELSLDYMRQYVDLNGEFIFRDYVDDTTHMLIFGTDTNREILRSCEVWAIDGTFKAVPFPRELKRMHVVMGLVRGKFIPLLFILMAKHRSKDFIRLFEELPITDRLKTIIVDFEKAQIKALRICFKDMQLEIKIKGCRFHFSQALNKKLKRMKVLQEFLEKGQAYSLLRPFYLLPFVPYDDIVPAFLQCKRRLIQARPNLADFPRYMEKMWIGKVLANGNVKKPVYPHILWNCRLSCMEGIPTTNNSIERFHQTFMNALHNAHPNFSTFMQNLTDEHTMIDYLIAQPQREAIPHRYMKIVASYDEYYSVLSYLDDLRNFPR